MKEKTNFIIDIGMPPLVEELKSYKGNVVILKERENMTEDYVYDYEDNVLKIYMKSLNKIDDFDKAMNIINECGIDHIDYIFPFNERKYEVYFEFINKYNIKSNLKENYVKNSKKVVGRKIVNDCFNDVMNSELKDINVDEFVIPCIIKPIVGNGSTDITKINTREELLSFIKNNEVSKYFAEKFIDGKEISIEAIHFNNKHLIYGITRKVKYENSFVEAGHVADYYQLNNKQVEKVMKIYDILGYNDTVSHTEFMLLNDDIVMVESHPRLGGDLIPSFYENKFNENMYEIFVKCLMGKLESVEELQDLKNTMFSIFPIPDYFPSIIELSEENKNDLRTEFGVDILVQSKDNGTLITDLPEDSFDRPLTLRASLDKTIDVDSHMQSIIEYCNTNVFKKQH